MGRIIKRLKTEEDGQSLVMIVLLLGVLLGFSALVVDVGLMYAEKSKLQNAADAAALAGAMELPDKTAAESVAEIYADNNEVPFEDVIITFPEKTKIKADVEGDVPYIFAKFLNLAGNGTTVKATAVAQVEYHWDGQALPLTNTGSLYTSENILLRTNKSPGDKSQIYDFYKKTSSTGKNSYYVKYDDGIVIDQGNGNTTSNIDGSLKLNPVVADILTSAKVGDTFYLLSVRSDIIDSFMNHNGSILVTDKDGSSQTRTANNGGLKAGDVIPFNMLVLLEVAYVDRKDANDTDIEMKYIQEYDIVNGVYPEGNEKFSSTTSKLIE